MHIAVLMGGPSAEFDISILSGIEVARHLLEGGRHTVRAVVMTKEKDFFFCDIAGTMPVSADFSSPKGSSLFKGPYSPGLSEPVWKGCEVAFLALHGSFGEDGRIQGYLDTIGMPYTGSGVFASSVAMNKIASKFIFMQNGLTTPPSSLYGKNHPAVTAETLARTHGFPLFVKCPQSGSSKLMGRAPDRDSLKTLLTELTKYSDEILVESAIVGVEFSCAVLEYPDGTMRPLPPVEIRPKASLYFDYQAKYGENASEEIVPAPRDTPLLHRIQGCALAVHRLIGCRGISRTDMIYNNDKLYVLETNTLPGLTATSLVPKCFAAQGGTYNELIDILVLTALKKQVADAP